ncbi:MAG TPA: heavy-metal-associated domain-containing protein [Acidimicrobiales bacterium]
MTTLNYLVPAIHCGHCKAAIESEVGGVAGVDRVEVDIESKHVTVDGEASEEAVLAAMSEAGYDEVQKV